MAREADKEIALEPYNVIQLCLWCQRARCPQGECAQLITEYWRSQDGGAGWALLEAEPGGRGRRKYLVRAPDGRVMTVAELAKKAGLRYEAVHKRIIVGKTSPALVLAGVKKSMGRTPAYTLRGELMRMNDIARALGTNAHSLRRGAQRERISIQAYIDRQAEWKGEEV